MKRDTATTDVRHIEGVLARLADDFQSAASFEISWPVRVIVAVLLVGGGSLLFAVPLGSLLASGPQSFGQVVENFRKPALYRPDWARSSGFTRCAEGWCLPPGGTGKFVYRPNLKTVVASRIHVSGISRGFSL